MLVHHHLPKTTGTTFNFGIAPLLIAPQSMLLLGSDMPLKEVSQIRTRHLRGMQFVSGHGLGQDDLAEVVNAVNLNQRNFLFGFARPRHMTFPSMLNQIVRANNE